MARIAPFQPYRYSAEAGKLPDLVTQPYDKISPAMQKRYLSQSPYNLVRVILGERFEQDTETDNVYTRAAHYFQNWVSEGILRKESQPSLFAYFQEFTVPDTGEKLTRKGFIGLGAVEEYSAGVVHRHEQTLSGPKKDRRQVLEHTRAHFGQIFMLYPDAEMQVDMLLEEAANGEPAASLVDEYGTVHTLYQIVDTARLSSIQQLMSDKKLVIADGHHRYETALAFKNDHPELEDAKWVMMTFVNMHSPGLRILATHRVVSGLPGVVPDTFLASLHASFAVSPLTDLSELTRLFREPSPETIRIGVSFASADHPYLLQRPRRPGELDVKVLHEELLENALGISSEAVRDEKHISYVRGVDSAAELVRTGDGQIAFLLEPTTVAQVSDTSFGGGVMPQKSTDFYPKLLTGLTIYKLEK